ncbi:helix-turn-helix domain-containing protein [Pseudonocardia oroxyli]|uniref:Transcriptional regulator, XRE family with cupin sensor n=1 Tax=Pseudonocardia oroxyli TaxID=366584 RepID=A0A1G7DKE9_PSEOR|nr:XRE family transcriptional regulator [Pseudonocardia oroxyli]SDE52044.1 transcriptional regulator, XRE family with cupin sensor [Pseudonocardia oroxyli]
MPIRNPQKAADVRLGQAIRSRRRALGRTLAQVAAASGLSQPFLSQLELGRTRPSMRSLFRIAEALGTTQQALLAEAGDDGAVLMVDSARSLSGEASSGAGPGARLLHHDPDLTEFVGLPREFQEFFSHARREALYVVRGTIEVELGATSAEPGATRVLGERDTLAYPGETPHRYRQLGAEQAIVLVVHSSGGDGHA